MKKFLVLALAASVSLVAASKSFAASDNETYTVTIPAVTNVVLTAAATNFGAIVSGDFGVDATAAHTILVGDGTGASTSYVESNDATATDKQYTITAAAGAGATAATIAAGAGGDAGKAVLTLANGTAASVEIRLEDGGKTTMPKLGDSGGTPVAFAVLGGNLNIAASSSVPFNATTGKAPLNMLMDLNESTITMADAAGSMSFTLTFTAVGL